MGKDDKKKKAYFIERKQIEGALEESENKYRSLFENVQDVFFETNLEGIILEISPSIKYFSEFNRDELLGTTIFNLYCTPEDRNVLLNTITLQGEIQDYEIKLKTKNGQIKVVSVNARLIIGTDGRPDRIDGSVRDITERKLTEEALSESETKYRYLFANNPQPMWIYDLETLTFLEVNQAAINHYGYSKEEFLSMTIKDIRPAEDIPALVDHLGLTRPIFNQAGTWRHIKKNGEIIFVEITSHLVLFNDRNARHVLIHDITGRKLAEEALSKSEQKYRNLHESMVDGFAFIDMQGYIKDYNESFKELLGYSDQELSLLNFRDFTPEKWQDFEHLLLTEQVLIRGFSDIYEKEYRKKDGTVFPVEVHTFLMKNDTGKNEGMWAIVRDITERKRAEEALTESRQQLLNIIDFLPDATFVVDNEKKVIAWNKAIEEMTGVQKQDMIGKRDHAYAIPFYGKQLNVFLDLIDNNDEELNARYSNVSRKGLSLHAEIFAPALYNGKGAYISVEGAPLFNGSGERIGSIESIRDITNQKIADQAIQESEERYRTLFERSNDAIFLVDIPSRYYLDANKSAEILTGRSLDELKRAKTHELTPKDASKRIKMLLDANDSLEMGEVEYVRPDGTIRTAVLSTIPLSKDQVFGIAHDITERKRAEEQLKLSNQRIALHIQHTPLAFIEFDLEGRVRGWNPAAVKIFGYSQEEAFGQYWTFIVPQGVWSSVDGVWEALVKQRGGSRSSNENITKIGQKISCEWYNTPLIDSDGKTLGVASLVMDITERKKAEQELLIAKEKADESNRLKTAFLNNISHEIRTPFNGILGFLSIIQDFDLTGSERDEYISIVNKSAYRLINTINDIVEISQIQTGQLKPIASEVNIKRLTDDLYNKFKTDAECQGLEFTINNDLPNDVAYISTDSTKLNTILSILIGNAIKFTEAGSVGLGIKFRIKAQLGYTPDGSIGEPVELEFSVKDTGIGIPIDRQEAIFELFMQADFSITRPFEGSGLGLSIAKAYVEMLGGKIWVESDPDNNSGRLGSTFYFTLPYKVITVERPGIDRRVSSDGTDNPITPEVPELKILIVEDDEISEMLLRKVVKSFSKEILHTTSGAEAVEAIRNNPDIDMILMDIRMPDLNGYEATKQIRQFNEKVVIFAQTAFAQSGDRELAIEAGCDDYIAKPVKKVELMELLQRYFKR